VRQFVIKSVHQQYTSYTNTEICTSVNKLLQYLDAPILRNPPPADGHISGRHTRVVPKVSVLIFYLNVYWIHLKLQVISFKV